MRLFSRNKERVTNDSVQEPVVEIIEQPSQSVFFMELFESIEQSKGLSIQSESPLVTAQVINGNDHASRRVLITLRNWNSEQLSRIRKTCGFGDDKTPTSISVSLRGGKIEGQVLYRTVGQDEQPQLDVSGNVENLTPGQVVGVGQLLESYDVTFSFTDTASAKDVRTTQSTTHHLPESYIGYKKIGNKMVAVDRYDNPIARPTAPDREQDGGDGLHTDTQDTDPELFTKIVEQTSMDEQARAKLVAEILDQTGGLRELVRRLALDLPPAYLQQLLIALKTESPQE